MQAGRSVWKQLDGGIFELYEIVPGVLLSTIAIVIVSLTTPAPSEAIRAGFAHYRTRLRET